MVAPVHEVKDLSLSTLRRQLEESRALLGAHLPVYQIHSATVESGILEDAAVREELARLWADGMLIGLTTTGPGQGETIERTLEVGGFDTVQATWNLLERSAGPALKAAHAAGLGVIIKETVANGRLTGREDIPLLRDLAVRRSSPRTRWHSRLCWRSPAPGWCSAAPPPARCSRATSTPWRSRSTPNSWSDWPRFRRIRRRIGPPDRP